jgi:hypothetical protein
VKCDERRPSCSRCVSSGRICDGYGVWGGGGSVTIPWPALPKCYVGPKVARVPGTLGAATKIERQQFEWFRCRSALKLPGLFSTPFWDQLGEALRNILEHACDLLMAM